MVLYCDKSIIYWLQQICKSYKTITRPVANHIMVYFPCLKDFVLQAQEYWNIAWCTLQQHITGQITNVSNFIWVTCREIFFAAYSDWQVVKSCVSCIILTSEYHLEGGIAC